MIRPNKISRKGSMHAYTKKKKIETTLKNRQFQNLQIL